MNTLRRISSLRPLLSSVHSSLVQPKCGLFKPRPFELYIPPTFKDVVIPEERKLPQLESTPSMWNSISIMKVPRRKAYMRGPETVHNQLLYKQFGVIALTGGELHIGHINMIRNTINKYLDTSKMFAIWRIPPPWKPITRRGPGKKSGGGKASIAFYATPVKAGRVIVEIGGQCEFEEVQFYLESVAQKLPCYAMATSQQLIDEYRQNFDQKKQDNINPITKERVAQLQMGNSSRLMSKYDKMWNFYYEYS